MSICESDLHILLALTYKFHDFILMHFQRWGSNSFYNVSENYGETRFNSSGPAIFVRYNSSLLQPETFVNKNDQFDL